MRLIEVDAFVKSINESIAEAYKWGANAQTDEIRIRAEQAIATFCEASLRARRMPEVDAVPVVRCGDCRYKDDGIDEDGYPFLKCLHGRSYGGTRINDYCSWGKRREDGDADDKR